MSHLNSLKEYKLGDRDSRPWGSYVVTSIAINDKNEEVCEKDITVLPGKILSLQSHETRRECWTVMEGTLTVILDDRRLKLLAGESINIALHAIHCMANLSNSDCVVHETQEGICREEDIIRYVDCYGRTTQSVDTDKSKDSIALYNEIIEEISHL